MNELVTPAGGLAVMSGRKSSYDNLDQFWTPPWGTRALCTALGLHKSVVAWDPCAGMRLMTDVLAEYCGVVHASDVYDYGLGDRVGSFVGEGADVVRVPPGEVDWIIFNPPFNIAHEFVERALRDARHGVAALVRLQWVESAERYRLFQESKPSLLLPFSGRLPMVQGRWDPDASSATAYAWVVWLKRWRQAWQVELISPDAKDVFTRPDDRMRFAPWSLVPEDMTKIEGVARMLSQRKGIDPDKMLSGVLSRDRQTYRERRDQRIMTKTVKCLGWEAHIREADDLIANELIRSRRLREAA
jgi:hypothetical protein